MPVQAAQKKQCKKMAQEETLDSKLKKSLDLVAGSKKQVRYLSYLFLSMGVYMAFSGAFTSINSRSYSEFMLTTGEIPFGHSKAANFTPLIDANMTRLETEKVAYWELYLTEVFRNIGLISIFMGGVLGYIGMAANNTVSKTKSKHTRRVFNKSFFGVVMFMVLYAMVSKHGDVVRKAHEHIHPSNSTVISLSKKARNLSAFVHPKMMIERGGHMQHFEIKPEFFL